MADWPTSVFADLYAVPSKNGLMAPSRVRGSGVRLINMREIFAYDRISDVPMELAPLPHKNRAEWLVAAGDLLFARQSLTLAGAGKCALVEPADGERTFESHIIRVRLETAIACPAFYYYYFRSARGRSNIESIVEQVAAAGIRASDLGRLCVPVPPVAEQMDIAATLLAMDDKIESNRRIQDLCLSLAELEFARLAPEAESGRLGDVATLVLGGTPDRKRPELWADGTVPWINSGCANNELILEPTEFITELGLRESAAKLMPAGATVVAITGATLGQVALLGLQTAGNQSLVGVWGEDRNLTAWLHFAVRSSIPTLVGTATGGAQQHVNKANIAELTVPVPKGPQLEKWGGIVVPLLDRAVSSGRESQRLAQLRDVTLNALLSRRVQLTNDARALSGASS